VSESTGFVDQFEELFAIAYRASFAILGERGEAEDCAQDALAKALARWSRFEDRRRRGSPGWRRMARSTGGGSDHVHIRRSRLTVRTTRSRCGVQTWSERCERCRADNVKRWCCVICST
jgi:hypothetical protein